MKPLLKWAAVMLWCVALSGPSIAAPEQPPSDNDASAPANVAPVTDPAQASAELRKVLSQPGFEEPIGPDTNTQVRDWLSRWFTKMGEDFSHFKYSEQMPRFASLLTSVFVVLSIAGLIYTFARLTRRRGKWDRPEPTDFSVGRTFRPPEFYEEELRRARAAGDWHEAWLASWRQFLSRLERSRMVEADRSRTNREYLTQLRRQPLPAPAITLLPALVDSYDQFIYGRKAIGAPEWHFFQEQVNEAALLLHLDDRASKDSPATTHP